MPVLGKSMPSNKFQTGNCSLIIEENPWVFHEALDYFSRSFGAYEEFTSIVTKLHHSKVL